MPRPSQIDKVIDAALHCFATQGYAATSIRNIADRAGVSEAALYRHYKSKEAVAQELFAKHLNEFALHLVQITDISQPIHEKLKQVVIVSLQVYRKNPDAFTFVLLKTPTFMLDLPPDTIYPLDVLEKMIAAGQKEGVVRDGQANLLAAIMMGCILRPIMMSQLADPGALDLLDDHSHDEVILEAALASISKQS